MFLKKIKKLKTLKTIQAYMFFYITQLQCDVEC